MTATGRLYEQAKEEALSLSREAKERAARLAEEQKNAVSESLDQFATAIESACEELKARDQTLAAQIVEGAAQGLGRVSRSIGRSSPAELVDALRGFGRSSPTAFLGGAVLAGLALGRFARASGSSAASGDRTAAAPREQFAPRPEQPASGAGPNSATEPSLGAPAPSAPAQPGSISTGVTA
jgi:hypothetical protein